MFTLFNALQIVVIFGCMPFILTWLAAATFVGASACWWLGLLLYIALFCMLVYSVCDSLEDRRK